MKASRAFCCLHSARQVSTSSLSKDYYQILGVERDATQRQIKHAYYQLSKKYHPDVAGRNAGTESKFIAITEAYECLKDPERRRIYDGATVGRGGRYIYNDESFNLKQDFGQRRRNPFYSKHYTQQEYERIWEQFKKMQTERDSYDAKIKEKLWEQFARDRATRWQRFHSRYPYGAPKSFHYEWKWNFSNPTGNRNVILLIRLATIYSICFAVVVVFQVISESLLNVKPLSSGIEDKRKATSSQCKQNTTFEYMSQEPFALHKDNWNNLIANSSSDSEAPRSSMTTSR
uniref:J domain-containing protein n=1 Tax=Haemonchus contortus TaxID=6289 RepID=A0A7I5EDG5_HAECO|nr:Heat shock protein DnaJ domain containing protein [Haemonchus contortus]